MSKSLARRETVLAVVDKTTANELFCIARDVFIRTEAACLRVNGVVFILVVVIAILKSSTIAVVTKDDVEVAVDSGLAGEVEIANIRNFLKSREKLEAKHPSRPDVNRQ